MRRGSWPPVLLAAGAFFIFLGERSFGVGHVLRPVFSIAGAILTLAAVALRLGTWASAGPARGVMGRLALAHLGSAAGWVLYAMGLPDGPLSPQGDASVVLRVFWVVVWLAGTLPAFFMEYSLQSMRGSEVLEGRRLAESGQAGLVVALAFSALVAANYTATERNVRVDFHLSGGVSPSPSTFEMIRNLTEPIEAVLFYPPASLVGDSIEPYFEELSRANPLFAVRRLDKDMNPAEAEAMRARKNGTVVIARGETRKYVRVDDDMDKARSKFKTFDADFQKELARVVRPERVAYLVAGHQEREKAPAEGEPSGVKDFHEMLTVLNFKVKKLDVGDGLSVKVPDDATAVFLIGPRYPLLEAEREALLRYVREGGSLFMLLDPEVEKDPDLGVLTDALGLETHGEILAHDTKFVQISQAKGDRTVLYTNRFTAHDSSPTLSRISTKVALILPTTGWLLPKKTLAKDHKVEVIVRSQFGTWADKDGNLEFDEGREKRQVFALTAAVQLPPSEGKEKGGRAIVGMDADLISDMVLRHSPANQQWAVDAIHWLEGDVETGGEVAEPEDIRILHTRDEDRIWFYGAIVGMPLLILGAGLAQQALRRRRIEA